MSKLLVAFLSLTCACAREKIKFRFFLSLSLSAFLIAQHSWTPSDTGPFHWVARLICVRFYFFFCWLISVSRRLVCMGTQWYVFVVSAYIRGRWYIRMNGQKAANRPKKKHTNSLSHLFWKCTLLRLRIAQITMYSSVFIVQFFRQRRRHCSRRQYHHHHQHLRLCCVAVCIRTVNAIFCDIWHFAFFFSLECFQPKLLGSSLILSIFPARIKTHLQQKILHIVLTINELSHHNNSIDNDQQQQQQWNVKNGINMNWLNVHFQSLVDVMLSHFYFALAICTSHTTYECVKSRVSWCA